MVTLRSLFFLTIFLNLLVYAWAQGYFGGREDGREPGRIADQLHPDRMKVAVVEKIAKSKSPTICRAVVGLSARDAELVRASLENKAEGGDALVISTRPAGVAPSHVVAISNLAGKPGAEKKAGELRALGVSEFSLGEDARTGTWSIVLGSFQAEQAEFLSGLNRKGVKSARIEIRDKVVERMHIEVRGAADLVMRRLPAALAGTSGATVGDCS
jgi:hypothetical protein